MHMQTVTPHRRTAEDHFEVVIRLRQSTNGQSSDSTLRLRAQALLKDLLMSRLELEAEINAHEYVHTRGFGDLGRALAASRALQLAFEGFRTGIPAARANVSVVLDSSPPDETVSSHAGLSVEQRDLLDLAKPSQVLITQAFYDRIALYQPALRSSTLRAGVYEFLWTSEQRLNELQAEAEFMPTLIQPPPAVVDFADTVTVPTIKPVPASRWKEPEPTYAPAPEPVPDDQVPARWFSVPRALAIGSAIAILGAVGYFVNLHSFSNQTKPVVPAPAHLEKPPVSSAQELPPPALPSTDIPARPAASNARQKIGPNPVKPPNPPVALDSARSVAQPPVSKPVTRPRGCTIDSDEIASYLSLAERYRSRGNYDHAISDYNIVLGCQPGNRSALDGLRKAEDAEKYSSP